MPTIDTTRCKGCGQCAEVCHAGAIKEDGQPGTWMGCAIDQDLCVDCGACLMMDCHGEAIQ